MKFKHPKSTRHEPDHKYDQRKYQADVDLTYSRRETLEQPKPRIPNHLHHSDVQYKSSITLHIVQLNHDISFFILKEILIGRIDLQNLFVPDLNLRDLPLSAEGISRKHLKLSYADHLWQVEDLKSRNGSWLNDKRLTPYQVYNLSNGDLLRLSNIAIKIKLSDLSQG